ncbi:MAG: transcription termination factor Rho, partial [Clostridia bacterium]|nr:transcription termination factor Rho [Clostridia bacterium]
ARNLKEGGSLTVIATALTETGSRMDDIIYEEFKGTGNMEIMLSRELAQKRVFPAIDILRSGTRKEELILPEEKIEAMYKFRSNLSAKSNVSEIFLEMIKQSNSNIEFVKKLPIWIKSILS